MGKKSSVMTFPLCLLIKKQVIFFIILLIIKISIQQIQINILMTKIQLDSLLEGEEKEINFNKKQFDDRDGQYLLKLQQSYNDDRFKITERFKDDINLKKISQKQKLDTDEARRGPIQMQKNQEHNNLLKILADVCPESKRFIDNDIKHKRNQNFMTQRFDPTNLKTQKLIIPNKSKEVKKEVFVPKVKKGIDKQKLQVIIGDEKLKVKQIQKQTKNIVKVKKINSQGWKNVLQTEEKSFSLFS